MKFFLCLTVLALATGSLLAQNIPQCSSDSTSGGQTRIEGWKTHEYELAPAERIAVPGSHPTVYQCLEHCTAMNPKCHLVSYNYANGSCIGYTRKGRFGTEMDQDSVILAKTASKKLHPVPDVIFSGNTAIGASPVHNVSNVELCKSLCLIQPTCNYAVFGQATFYCWLNWVTDTGHQHTAAKIAENKFTGFWAH